MNQPLPEFALTPHVGAPGARFPLERTTPLHSNSRARRLRRRPIAERGARHATPATLGDNVIGLPAADHKGVRTPGIQGNCTTRSDFAKACGGQSAPPAPDRSVVAQPASERIPLRMRSPCFANGYRPKPRTPAHSPTDTVRSPAYPAVLDHPTRHPTIRPQEPPTK